MIQKILVSIFLASFFFFQCREQNIPLFKKLESSQTGIEFSNTLSYTEEFNPYTYRNFYNGGGVALGDINNDGLLDILFTGNIVDNRLFLNLGNWKYEDITEKAGVACSNVWSSGATFVDINSDGLLDLYICKSGKPEGEHRNNELFINNGDLTFTERSKEYGLDIYGLSTHAAFFDYDKDGDLDCYILSNSIRSLGAFDFIRDQRNTPDPNGNKFLRNENGIFSDVTSEVGIYSSAIGFGLGITLSDFNSDGWTDIFVSNDFFERDYLYLNDQNGAFLESLEKEFQSISMGSMGADAADLNNDQKTDMMVTEMLPASLARKRTKTVFESWDKYQLALKNGYFHQFSRNVLQRNTGSEFLEIGRYSNLAATEWSWAALIFDMDNDGLKDIFISNGIYKDLLDRDYLAFTANDENVRAILREKNQVIKQLIDIIPSCAVPNQAFKNLADFNFDNVSEYWGFSTPSFSNGSAYGDLDNDGDLDLVVNNVNMQALIYQNRTDTSKKRSLRIKLNGEGSNTQAIGATIKAYRNYNVFSVENYPSRGFESSVDPILHLGLGEIDVLDSLEIIWPKGSYSTYYQIPTNQLLVISESTSRIVAGAAKTKNWIFKSEITIPIVHKENNFIDFDRNRLLIHMLDTEGPAISIADINNDGLMDVFLGGAKGFSDQMAIQNAIGFSRTSGEVFKNQEISEDVSQVFFDCDGDGDQDLYVASGGRSFGSGSSALMDRLYLNDGMGNFSLSEGRLPFSEVFSSSVVTPADIDGDGDIDLFIGERFKPFYYGYPVRGYVLLNNGLGFFEDVTTTIFPDLLASEMITDAVWADISGDGQLDLIISTEWGPIKLLVKQGDVWKDATDEYGLSAALGWWNTLLVSDIDHDGDLDILAGNHGKNSFFKDSTKLYISDFDNNGSQDHIYCHLIKGKYYPVSDRDELVAQLPMLKKKILHFSDYANMDMEMLFSQAQLAEAHVLEAMTLSSSVFINSGQKFQHRPLPGSLQYAPIYAICKEDINQDGFPDYLFGGNLFGVKPMFGRYDALPVTVWYGTPSGLNGDIRFTSIMGQVRDLKFVSFKNKRILVVGKNDEAVETYEFKK